MPHVRKSYYSVAEPQQPDYQVEHSLQELENCPHNHPKDSPTPSAQSPLAPLPPSGVAAGGGSLARGSSSSFGVVESEEGQLNEQCCGTHQVELLRLGEETAGSVNACGIFHLTIPTHVILLCQKIKTS